MTDLLRSFRLGTINLIGVTVPGIIVLLLIYFGFVEPLLLLLQKLTTDTTSLIQIELPKTQLFEIINPTAVIIILLILAYIIGYIFRLSTPDDLDKISAKRVIEKMGGTEMAKADHWPHHGEPDNKFPYFHFNDYLKYRKHNELVKYVKWDKNCRSKTFVNKMKLITSIRSPHLSAIIESNEAHIRLLFGTWHASRLCLPFVIIGFVTSLFGLIFFQYYSQSIMNTGELAFQFFVWLLVTIVMILGSLFISNRIKNLFHYRRVRELFDIVACTHLACMGFDASGQKKSKSN